MTGANPEQAKGGVGHEFPDMNALQIALEKLNAD
jgi:hypothetical protein